MQGLEPLFQEFRIAKIWSHLPKRGVIVDLGCDYEQTLLLRCRGKFQRLIGVDIVATKPKSREIELVKADLTKKSSVKAGVADVVTMLAVLEHLKGPEKVVAEVYRILKPGGVFLATVPSPLSEKVLPTMAKMHLVRQDMIDQHENYFTHEHLKKILKQAGFKHVTVETWEFGFNTFIKAVK